MLQQFATWKAAEGLRYPLLSHLAYSTLWDLQLSGLTTPGRR